MKFLLLFLCFTVSTNAIRYSNENLMVEKSDDVQISSNASITCEIVNSAETLDLCQFETPLSGITWDISLIDGSVTFSNNGTVVPGVNGVTSDKICGIEINSMIDENFGDWTCKLTRSNGATNVLKGKVNLRDSGDVPNVRLIGTTIPSHYDLSFIALWDEWDPVFSVEGKKIIYRLISNITDLSISFSFFSEYTTKVSNECKYITWSQQLASVVVVVLLLLG